MEADKELYIKLKSLEEENRFLRGILGESMNRESGALYNSGLLSGAATRSMLEKTLASDHCTNSGIIPEPATAVDRLSTEKYISSLSRKLNSHTDERSVLKTVLQDLSVRSSSSTLYYVQIDESSCIVSSLFTPEREDEEEVFSFQEHSFSKNDLGISLEDLYALGCLIIRRRSAQEFFTDNSWIRPPAESAMLIPVIVQNEILGIIVLDITGIEEEITPVDIMLYQTVSSIVTGSLKRIAYENRIRDRKERYELIIENTSHLLFQTLPDGTITFANRRFSGFFGIDPAELHGRIITSVPGIDSASLMHLISSLAGASGPLESELSFFDHNKKERIIKLSVNPVLSESGNILLVNFMGEDITEKKALENELLHTKKRLDLAFLASNDAYWDANLITGEFFYSHNFYRMLDYHSSEMPSLFRDFLKLVHPDDLPAVKVIMKKCLKGEVIRTSLRFRAVSSSGEYKWIFSRMMIIESDEEGKPVRLIGTNVDLTATVKIEEKLKENAYKLMEAQRIARLGYWEYDHAKSCFVWDRTLSEMMGFTDEHVVIPEAEMLSYIHGDDRKRVVRSFYKSIKDRDIHNEIIRYINRSGETVFIRQTSKTDYSTAGVPIITRGICFDITELKKTELELVKAKDKAEESNRLKSAFLANMSHEARTPLNSIMGFSELLNDKEISQEDKTAYAEIIRESSRQLTSLISDILDISKIDARLMVINRKPVHLNRIVDYIHGVFRNGIKDRPVTLEFTKGLDDGGDLVITDETRVQQILNNLLVNALKFTESGSVRFGYTLTDDRKFIQFHVSDTGIGIPKNRQKMIFGRFKQADPSIGRKYGGTGLGLSINRELCRLLGGKIWVRSEVNRGSTFYFKIPYDKACAEGTGESDTLRKRDEHISILKNRRILIVDDNRSVHRLLAAIFKKYGAIPLSAEGAREALDIISGENPVDIVLLDIQMPDLDGTEAVALIKELVPHLPVVAQTANALEDDRKQYLKLGFDGYIAKPYNREELITTVISLINIP